MFQLYKERNFNALINDTFGFIRQSGKNYFKNYLIFSGGMLLILVVLMYLVGKVFFQSLFTGIDTGDSPLFDEYFNSGSGYFIAAAVVSVILILVVSLISFSFPIFYFTLAEKNTKPDSSQILQAYKSKIGRVIIYGLWSLITFLPIGIIANIISTLMFSLFIGIPVGLIIMATYSAWICLSLFVYLNSDKGFFSAMKTGWNMLFKNYWAHMGSTAIFYIITFVAQLILVIIPYFIVMFYSIVNADIETDKTDTLSFMGLMMLIIFILYIVLAFFFGNIIMINQGMIYYSCKEEDEKQSVHSEIDLIGTDSE